MDKVLLYENIIQAFSRTNRLFGPDKPFGTIRYYRRPHTMEININDAVKLYSGDKPIGLFVEKLEYNLEKSNSVFSDISILFNQAGILDFEKLPDDFSERGRFAKLFKNLNSYLEAAKIQGFKWNKTKVTMTFDENTYLILALRYKELFSSSGGTGGFGELPYDLAGYLTEIDTAVIDANYMNTRFNKFLKLIHQEGASQELIDQALSELHKTFATLTQEEQKYANMFLHDIQRGDMDTENGKTLRDYITEYQCRAKEDQINRLFELLGIDKTKLRNLMRLKVTEANINEFGRFDELKNTVDKSKAKAYFEAIEKTAVPLFKVNIKVDGLLRSFLISGGFEIELAEEMVF
jgi:type I restriction enzyme R subunit